MSDAKNTVPRWWVVVTFLITVLGGTGWFQFSVERRDSATAERERLVAEYLQPIQRILQENETIFEELTRRYDEAGTTGLLETYLVRIRRDGVQANSVYRERLNTLVENNQTIVQLLQLYQGRSLTEQFPVQSQAFRDHAQRYRARWAAIPDLLESDGQLDHAEDFPSGFPTAIAAELAVQLSGR